MSNSHDKQVKGLDLAGFFRGRVVKNDDPMGEGRVAVFIPSLITEYPQGDEIPSPGVGIIPPTLFANQKELGLPQQVKRDNFVWARPGSQFVENGSAAKNHGGDWRIPRVGTMVTVYFEGADPNRPYWLPFTPTVRGDVIAAKNLGKGINVQGSSANWKSIKQKVEIQVVAEHDNGNVVYIDNNSDVNAFVIRWDNGHTISIHHNKESGIVMHTQRGHMVQLDENSTEIRLRTHTGKTHITMNDANGTIYAYAASKITLHTPHLHYKVCTTSKSSCAGNGIDPGTRVNMT